MAAYRRMLPTLVARARLSRLRSPVPPSPQPNGRGAGHTVRARMHDVDAGLKLDARVGSAVPEEVESARGAGRDVQSTLLHLVEQVTAAVQQVVQTARELPIRESAFQ